MTKSVWKFKVPIQDTIKIAMPFGAKVLFVALQQGEPHLWAEVKPNAGLQDREFRIYGTGWEMPDDPGRYLGSLIMSGGGFVWHVYE